MKNKYWFVSIIIALTAYGCSDDKIGITVPDQDKISCTSDDECKPGKCVEYFCEECTGEDCESNQDKITYLEEGATCNPEDTKNVCKDPLVCEQNTCKKSGSSNETGTCQSSDECASMDENHQTCLSNGVCGKYIEEGDACDPKDTKSLCKTPYICHQNTCKTSEQAELDEQCQSNDDCASEDADHQTCLSNKICGKYVEPGGTCSNLDDSDKLCQDDYSCTSDICLKILNENDPCDIAQPEICDPEKYLSCIDGECHQYKGRLPKGEICNSSYLSCDTGLTCYAQNPDHPEETKCTQFANEDEECDETDNIFCADKLYCKEMTVNDSATGSPVTKHICTPIGLECTRTADCTEKDSYCCLSEEACSDTEFKHCIPYNDKHDHDEMCRFRTKPGIFEAQIQCRWQPPSSQVPASKNVEMPPLVGKFGKYKKDPNSESEDYLETVVAFYSYNSTAIRFMNPETCETLETVSGISLAPRWYNYPASADLDGDGLMEFIACTSTNTLIYKWDDLNKKHIQWLNVPVDTRATPMVFDINNDGNPEIVSPIGPAFTVFPDGTYEVLTTQDLFQDPDANTNGNYYNEAGTDAAIGHILPNDFPDTAQIMVGDGLYNWNKSTNSWDKIVSFPFPTYKSSTWIRHFSAYADFGTPGDTAEEFDFEHLDGLPELVVSGKNRMLLYAVVKTGEGIWDKQEIAKVTGFNWGGPVTIGDFNNDGLPEIAIASKGMFGVYDPKCKGYEAGKCADKNVMWERWSQDSSSGTTGSSLFDFDGDGQAEAVYADECFLRVYDGKSGAILFSAKRSSITSIEGPVIADIDGDGSAEILMGSDGEEPCYNDKIAANQVYASDSSNDAVDPLHEGIRCEDNADCPTNNCDTNLHLCLCTSDNDCNTQYAPGKDTYLKQYICTAPIDPQVGFYVNTGAPGQARTMPVNRGTRPAGWNETSGYKVCRATRKTTDIGIADLMIFRDRLDRWVSSRNMWNQHAYNIININDNGKVPSLSEWLTKFTQTALVEITEGTNVTKVERQKYNNYRMNEQGAYGAGVAPDITGRFIADSVCGTRKDADGNPILDDNGNEIHIISGKLCNRGTKPVGTNLPATFFYYDETQPDNRGEKICTSYTDFIVGIGECFQVGCELSHEAFQNLPGKTVLMVSNLNEHGNASTVECNKDNNTDTITIQKCDSEIEIAN